MIRKTRYITETCCRCKRPGWKHQKPYVLITEDEQKKIYGDLFSDSKEIKGISKSTERCAVRGSASIHEAVKEGKELSKQLGMEVVFKFNEQVVVVNSLSDVESVVRKWWIAVYHETPEESSKRR